LFHLSGIIDGFYDSQVTTGEGLIEPAMAGFS
jgi:hypothetical protein